MGMKLTKDTGGGGGPVEPPEAGNHEARVAAVIPVGTHPEMFQGQPVGDKAKLYVVYELTDEQDSKGDNKLLGRDYTLSGHEKSGLRKLCEAAFGPEPEGGYDLEKLAGCAVAVSVDINDKGYPGVGAVTPLRPAQKQKVPRGQQVPFYYDFDAGGEYRDHDWIPWIFSRAAGKRVKVSEMIAQSRERTGEEVQGKPAPARQPARQAGQYQQAAVRSAGASGDDVF